MKPDAQACANLAMDECDGDFIPWERILKLFGKVKRDKAKLGKVPKDLAKLTKAQLIELINELKGNAKLLGLIE